MTFYFLNCHKFSTLTSINKHWEMRLSLPPLPSALNAAKFKLQHQFHLELVSQQEVKMPVTQHWHHYLDKSHTTGWHCDIMPNLVKQIRRYSQRGAAKFECIISNKRKIKYEHHLFIHSFTAQWSKNTNSY